jgi:hypothetical protein
MTLQSETMLRPAPSAPAATGDLPVRVHGPLFAGAWRRLKRVGAFAVWVLTGFGLLGHLLGRSRAASRGKPEEIVVYTVPRAFFLWALILVGFVAAAWVRHDPHTAVLWGWVYVWVLLYTFVTLVFDTSTWKFLLWAGIATLVWLTSKYLEDVRDMYLLSGVLAYLRDLHPRLDAGFATVISWLLLFPWVGGLFHAFGRGRKTFSPNGIEEWFLGEGREILDRSGLKFRSRYRDVFETLLGFGAGDLEAVDANQHVVKRWEGILFLFFHWRRLDEVLHQRAAVVDTAPGDPIQVKEANPLLVKEVQ